MGAFFFAEARHAIPQTRIRYMVQRCQAAWGESSRQLVLSLSAGIKQGPPRCQAMLDAW